MQTITERPADSLDSFSALTAAIPPDWHASIQRLASATERVAVRMDAWGAATSENGGFVRECRDLAKALIDFLDEADSYAQTELEGDYGYVHRPEFEGLERDDGDDEPSLASLGTMNQENWSRGAPNDLEGEHDGREPDVDDELSGDDGEPSLGSLSAIDQRGWSDGGDGSTVDAEKDDTDPARQLWPVVCRLTDKGAEVLASVTLI